MDKRKQGHTSEHNHKISLANKGRNKYKHLSPSTEFKKGMIPWNKGLTKEGDLRVNNISINLKGKKNPHYGKKQSKELIEKRFKNIVGRKNNSDTIKKMSISRKEFLKHNKLSFPRKDTSIEIKIQEYLKQLKIEFFTHYKFKEIEHSFSCDIFIPVQKSNTFFIRQPIVIECDGNYWHNFPTGRDIDRIRNNELKDKGLKVIRIWESEIKKMQLNDLKEKLNGISL